jgi:hypothetical protein
MKGIHTSFTLVMDHFPTFFEYIQKNTPSFAETLQRRDDSNWLRILYDVVSKNSIVSMDEEYIDDNYGSVSDYFKSHLKPLIDIMLEDYEIMLTLTAFIAPGSDDNIYSNIQLIIPMINSRTNEKTTRRQFLYELRYDYLTWFHTVSKCYLPISLHTYMFLR